MKWNKVTDKRPLCTDTGEWDGLRSSPILVMDKSRDYHVAVCYSGILDGNKFTDFVTTIYDSIIDDVVAWAEIEEYNF